MTAAPGMRDLAHRLLTYEAGAGRTSEPMEFATLRVYEKLRQSLSAFAGVAAFESLAFRALTQAKSEAPGLSAARVTADGSLQGLGEFDPQVGIDKNQTAARRSHSHRPVAQPASYLPWRNFNVEAGAGCMARRQPSMIAIRRTGETREHTR